jgi:hypothetical protein
VIEPMLGGAALTGGATLTVAAAFAGGAALTGTATLTGTAALSGLTGLTGRGSWPPAAPEATFPTALVARLLTVLAAKWADGLVEPRR